MAASRSKYTQQVEDQIYSKLFEFQTNGECYFIVRGGKRYVATNDLIVALQDIRSAKLHQVLNRLTEEKLITYTVVGVRKYWRVYTPHEIAERMSNAKS